MTENQKRQLKEIKAKYQATLDAYYSPLPTEFRKVTINSQGKVLKDTGSKGSYAIAKPLAVARGDMFGKQPEMSWIKDQSLPTFESRIDAIRYYVSALEPDLRNSSDEYIQKYFNRTFNGKIAKIIKGGN